MHAVHERTLVCLLPAVCPHGQVWPLSFPGFVPRLLPGVSLSSCQLESEEGSVAFAALRSQYLAS